VTSRTDSYADTQSAANARQDPEANGFNKLRKKEERCHSERRFCAKNPSLSFVLNTEGFFASPRREPLVRALRMTTKGLFRQLFKSIVKR